MTLIKSIDRIARGKASRREVAEIAALAGLVTVASPLMHRPAVAQAGSDLSYFTWGGFEAPELFPSYAETWGEPSTSFYGDEYEAIEKMRAGFEADVVSPCIDVMPSWMRAGLQPIDETRLIYLDDVFESIRSPEAAFDKGERFYVPTFYGFSSFVYRTDLTEIAPDDESWTLFFDETFKDRMAIWDSTDAVVPVASLASGITDNPYGPDGADLDKVQEMMRVQRDLVRFYFTDQTTALQGITTGEVVLSYAWSSFIPALIDSGISFKWAQPREGMLGYVCGLARGNREGTDEALVYDFINANMSPEAGKFLIEAYASGAANKNAYALVDADVLESNGLSTPEVSLASAHMFQFVPVDLKQRHIAIFDEVRAGF